MPNVYLCSPECPVPCLAQEKIINFHQIELLWAETANCPPTSFLPYSIIIQSFSWKHGCLARDYISQPPLQLGVGMWLGVAKETWVKVRCALPTCAFNRMFVLLAREPELEPMPWTQRQKWYVKIAEASILLYLETITWERNEFISFWMPLLKQANQDSNSYKWMLTEHTVLLLHSVIQ